MASFWELSSERGIGMGGVGPIPWSCMRDYAKFHQLESDVTRAFIQIMRTMDAVFLEDQAEEIKRKQSEEEEKIRSRERED